MYITELSEVILYQFSKRTDKDRPFFVAIDGLSGAGKTTLVKKLEHELLNESKVIVIHIDDHIVERNKRYNTGHEEWREYYELQWDINLLRHHLFERLYQKAGNVKLPFYNHTSDSIMMKQVLVPTSCILLIEGIFLQRKEWKEFYDFIIFLECPREIRYERALNRDAYLGEYEARLRKYKKRYWPAEGHYFRAENPLENANIIFTATQI